MAKDKKSIIVYSDWINKFEALEDDEAGRLIKHFFRYVNDLDPEPPDRITQLAFIDIQQTLKRDLSKWDKTRSFRSEIGRLGGIKSGESRKSKQTNQTLQNRSKPKQTEANEAVSVSVSVSDSVNVSDKRGVFTPPAKDDVFNEMIKKIDDFTAHGESEKFCDFYESKGWFVGKNKMKDWKSAVRNWLRGMNKFNQNGNSKKGTSTSRVEALQQW